VLPDTAEAREPPAPIGAAAQRSQSVRDSATGVVTDWAVYDRAALAPGAALAGPAIIAEDETSTLVGPGWNAAVDAHGYILLTRGAQATGAVP
jgi:N-methylhydantoinase A